MSEMPLLIPPVFHISSTLRWRVVTCRFSATDSTFGLLTRQPLQLGNVHDWNCAQVCEFPSSLYEMAKACEEQIDGRALMLLREDHLLGRFQLPLGPAHTFWEMICQLLTLRELLGHINTTAHVQRCYLSAVARYGVDGIQPFSFLKHFYTVFGIDSDNFNLKSFFSFSSLFPVYSLSVYNFSLSFILAKVFCN